VRCTCTAASRGEATAIDAQLGTEAARRRSAVSLFGADYAGERTGLSTRRVQTILRDLADEGYISRVPAGRHRHTVFVDTYLDRPLRNFVLKDRRVRPLIDLLRAYPEDPAAPPSPAAPRYRARC
jgi:hypothetical protein